MKFRMRPALGKGLITTLGVPSTLCSGLQTTKLGAGLPTTKLGAGLPTSPAVQHGALVFLSLRAELVFIPPG
jgi:hypothetical protein